MKSTDAEKLQNEYQRLVEGLRDADAAREEDAFMANPALPDDLLKEAIPGNIRRAEHFVAFLKRFVEYLKTWMKVLHVIAETPHIVFAASKRADIHREEATKILCRKTDFSCANFRTYKH